MSCSAESRDVEVLSFELFVVKMLSNGEKEKENFECTKADAAACIRDLYFESLQKKTFSFSTARLVFDFTISQV